MRRLAAATTCLVLGAGLVACGGEPSDEYCGVVKEHRTELNDLVEADTQFGLITHLPMLQELADAAPRDLADEWQVFLGAVKQLARAVDDSGHAVEDFADGAVPDDLADDDRASITAAADRLASSETVAATQGIDQQARDVCKVNLGR